MAAMDPYDELRLRVGAALAEIQQSPGPEAAPGAHHSVTELRVHPSGEVVVRVGHPVQIARLTPADPAPPVPVGYDTSYYPPEEPSPWTTPVQSIEPPAFSVAEEELLLQIQTATSLTREQLVGHLLRRLLAAEAQLFAREQGLGGEPEDASGSATSAPDVV